MNKQQIEEAAFEAYPLDVFASIDDEFDLRRGFRKGAEWALSQPKRFVEIINVSGGGGTNNGMHGTHLNRPW